MQTSMRGLIIPSDKMHSIAWGVLHTVSDLAALRRAILQQADGGDW